MLDLTKKKLDLTGDPIPPVEPEATPEVPQDTADSAPAKAAEPTTVTKKRSSKK